MGSSVASSPVRKLATTHGPTREISRQSISPNKPPGLAAQQSRFLPDYAKRPELFMRSKEEEDVCGTKGLNLKQ